VRVFILAVLFVDFDKCVDVSTLAGSGGGVMSSDFLALVEGFAAGVGIAVMPEAVIVRHGNAPIRHGTLRIVSRNIVESLPCLLVWNECKSATAR